MALTFATKPIIYTVCIVFVKFICKLVSFHIEYIVAHAIHEKRSSLKCRIRIGEIGFDK